MLSKLIVAGLGIAAAIILAPQAAADLTNAEVAGGQHVTSSSTHSGDEVVIPYDGPKSGYWMTRRDAQGRPYTDANGRVIQKCMTNSCDRIGETRVAPTACGNTAPVNEDPTDEAPKPVSADAE